MTRQISRRDFLRLMAAAAGTGALGLTACGGSGSSDASGDKTYKIGVLQLTQHAALDAANEGFVEALDASGIKYTVDQQNANNDQSACATIASKLVGDGDDLIFAIATPAAQAVAAATSDIPIVAPPSPTTPPPASSPTTTSPEETSPARPT